MSTKTVEPKGTKADEKVILITTANEVKPTVDDKKVETLAIIEKFKPEPILTAEARIEKMKQFEALSNRFGSLKIKANDLKTFKAGNDKMNAKIVFQNAQGFNFEVQNSNVIQKLVESAELELSILLNEAENEVLTFEI